MSMKRAPRRLPTPIRFFPLLVLTVLLTALGPPDSQAAPGSAGKVLFVKGITTAQQPGAGARIIGRGQALYEGDLLSTGNKSYAVIRLADNTRMTLRPGTRFRIDKLDAARSTGSALLSLFKGGLRVITGYLSKHSPKAFRLVTPVATIGIRGTEFDARLCADECAAEVKNMRKVETSATSPVLARVVMLRGGVLLVRDLSGVTHTRFKGGPIYQGDTLITARASAVIAFRDGTRVSLRPGTEFQVEHYTYSRKAPETGNAFLRLLKGGVRTLTGFLATKRSRFFRLVTPVATIGIRGTGFDVVCDGACAAGTNPIDLGAEQIPSAGPMSALPAGAACRAGEDFHAYVWQGEITLQNASGVFALGTDQATCIPADSSTPALLAEVPHFMQDNPTPRPDTVPVDLDKLFTARAPQEARPGLYVSVDEGHILIEQGDRTLNIGGGESAYADPVSGVPVRIIGEPPVIRLDPYPRPRTFDPANAPVIGLGPPGGGPPGGAPLACIL